MQQLYFHDKGAKESSVNWKGGKIEAKEPTDPFNHALQTKKSLQCI